MLEFEDWEIEKVIITQEINDSDKGDFAWERGERGARVRLTSFVADEDPGSSQHL